jgi:hypothetical protein
MAGDFHDRVTDQFAYRGGRADIWRPFGFVLDTDAFLSLGYSGGTSPNPGIESAAACRGGRAAVATAGGPLVDMSCKRSGPAI